MNIFRFLGDITHVVSYVILFLKIYKTKSTTGISGKMYLLFVLMFATRYLDLLQYFISVYNTLMKVLFITVSCTMVFLIHMKYPSKEKDLDSFNILFLIIPTLMLAVLVELTIATFVNHYLSFIEVFWTFSIFLEAVAILPQLFLVYKIDEVDIFICYSMVALASYRGFYIFNWIYRYIAESHYDIFSIMAGVIQTILYTFTAAVVVDKYNQNIRKSKLAVIESLKEDIIKDREFINTFQDKKAAADHDATIINKEVKDYPMQFYIEADLLKMENNVAKDESLPNVFLLKKGKQNEPVAAGGEHS